MSERRLTIDDDQEPQPQLEWLLAAVIEMHGGEIEIPDAQFRELIHVEGIDIERDDEESQWVVRTVKFENKS